MSQDDTTRVVPPKKMRVPRPTGGAHKPVLRFLQPKPATKQELAAYNKGAHEKAVSRAHQRADVWSGCFEQAGPRLVCADLLTVERSDARYELGEIAHIENVMATEKRVRKHTVTHSTETYFVEDVETTKAVGHDLVSTDRFELEDETERVARDSVAFETGAAVTAGIMFVNLSSDVSFGYGSESSDVARDARSYSQATVEQAIERIVERARALRAIRTSRELKEKNLHSFDNSEGDENRCGIYRWLDKVYDLEIENHGPRLMLDLMVPDPGAIARRAFPNLSELTPTDPEPSLKSPQQLGLQPSFAHLAAGYIKAITEYGVDLDPPPESKQLPVTPISVTAANGTGMGQLNIPAGLEVKKFDVSCTVVVSYWEYDNDWPHLDIQVSYGGHSFSLKEDDFGSPDAQTGEIENLSKPGYSLQGNVAVHATGHSAKQFALTMTAECAPTGDAKQAWLTTTWQSINEAYTAKLASIEATEQANEQVVSESSPMRRGESLIRDELRRLALYLITGSDLDHDRSALYPTEPGLPSFIQPYALAEGEMVRFLEQAFDWPLMTAVFYPYYWASQDQWIDRVSFASTDSDFERFMKSGFARLVVPVRRGQEIAVLNYMQSGCPSVPPGAPYPLYAALADELRPGSDDKQPPVDYGEPWTVRVPTSLMVLEPVEFLGAAGEQDE